MQKKYRITSFEVKNYRGNIEVFINDDEKEFYFSIHIDKDFVQTKKQIKEIINGYFGKTSEWSGNGKIQEIIDKIYWYIR